MRSLPRGIADISQGFVRMTLTGPDVNRDPTSLEFDSWSKSTRGDLGHCPKPKVFEIAQNPDLAYYSM